MERGKVSLQLSVVAHTPLPSKKTKKKTQHFKPVKQPSVVS